MVNFFKTQNAYARSVLAKLGAPRQRLFDRIKVLDNAGVSVSSVVRDGDRYFYEKLKPGENSEKLYVREANGTERVLVDPEKLASAGKHYTINYFLPSLDGSYVAYGISEGGSEASVIHVVETATGTILPDAIDRAYFVGATSWLPDGKSFYYVRFPELKPGEPEVNKETRAVNYLHVLGRNPDRRRTRLRVRREPEGDVRNDRFSDRGVLARVETHDRRTSFTALRTKSWFTRRRRPR